MSHSVIKAPTDAIAQRVRAALSRADYIVDNVINAITDEGQRALTRNHTLAAHDALAGRDDPLSTMIRLFILQEAESYHHVISAGIADLLECGILTRQGDRVTAEVDIRPYTDEIAQVEGWVMSDHAATLNTCNTPPVPDHVLGISPASVSLSQITPVTHGGSALDLGTGSGIQCLRLAKTTDHVVATDLNQRALDLAAWTFALSDITIDTRLGSLYEPVRESTFDMIMTNPPFVMSPQPDGVASRLVYRESSLLADTLMREVVSGAGRHLNPGGSLHVLGNWAHVTGEPWQERLHTWIPEGCDAFIVQREVLDVYEYIEIWLADAGVSGTADYMRRYRQWLDYFHGLGIESVGMGWITMVNSGAPRSRVECLDWPHPVDQFVADDLMAHLTAMQWRDLSDEEILDVRWTLAKGTVQETMGEPGNPDPTHVVLRRGDGLKRAIEVDTALGGVLGACDGELNLGQIINAVAQVLDVPNNALTTQILAQVRDLVATTWLVPLL